MRTHILPGDALLETFRTAGIKGDVIVCRECLIDGPVSAETLDEFWKMRAGFLAIEYGADERKYYSKAWGEFKRIMLLPPGGEVCLWFEYDLFCQVNMWFILSLLSGKGIEKICRVEPAVRTKRNLWRGFGDLNGEALRTCYERRVQMSKDDVLLGADLWEAYRAADLKKLAGLSRSKSPGFPYLMEVCKAEIERKKDRRPERTLQELIDEGLTDFKVIFRRFTEKEGIYGFGDVQVEAMYRKLKAVRKGDPA